MGILLKLLAAAILLMKCGKESTGFFEDEYVAIPRREDFTIERARIGSVGDCIRITQEDSVVEEFVVGYEPADSAKAKSLIERFTAESLSGHTVTKQHTFEKFGEYPSVTRYFSLDDPKDGRWLNIVTHYVTGKEKILVVLTRNPYSPRDPDWWDGMREWVARWKVK